MQTVPISSVATSFCRCRAAGHMLPASRKQSAAGVSRGATVLQSLRRAIQLLPASGTAIKMHKAGPKQLKGAWHVHSSQQQQRSPACHTATVFGLRRIAACRLPLSRLPYHQMIGCLYSRQIGNSHIPCYKERTVFHSSPCNRIQPTGPYI